MDISRKTIYSYLFTRYAHVYSFIYRTFKGIPLDKFSLITPNLVLAGQYKRRAIPEMKKVDIAAVVSMRQSSYIRKDMLANHDIDFLQLPTRDRTAPTVGDLRKGVRFIKKYTSEEKKVYVHCRAGVGRGPTMAIAYLISEGISFDAAIERIERVRPFINPTKPQIKRLREFEKLINH